jgi:DNA-binding SARP family transcriptional activator
VKQYMPPWIACWIVSLLSILTTSFSASAQTNEVVQTPSQRLSTEFARLVMARMASEPLHMDGVELAQMLLLEAVKLDPQNLENWQLMLEVGLLSERDDMVRQATENILRLDPENQQARLLRLNQAIEQYNTAEERVAAYNRLLDPQNIDQIGAPVASRLAFDLALLHRRNGNTQGFVDALTQSLALDSTHRAAAALATGYFEANVNDAFALAELYTNLFLADPSDVETATRLAKILLENGAYAGARRLYDLVDLGNEKNGVLPQPGLIADQAIAHWASGDSDGALSIFTKYVHTLNAQYGEQVWHEQPELTGEQVRKLEAPLDPTLAAVRAVIASTQKGTDSSALATAALKAYQIRIDAMKASTTASSQPASSVPASRPADPADIARLTLEAAWIAAWIGPDSDAVSQFMDAAATFAPLSDAARNRFEGWIAYRKGDLARAQELLSPLANEDLVARAGLASVMIDQGRRSEGARELLSIARAQPGSLLGIWSANRVINLVGQRVPLSDEATKIEQLIASIPTAIDRYPQNPTSALSLKLIPNKKTYGPLEPIILSLEITNNSVIPLGIDRAEAIRPQIMLGTSVNSAYLVRLNDMSPFVVDIGKRFRLEPRQSLVVNIDLRRRQVGSALNTLVRNGANINARGYINFRGTTYGAVQPSLYGSIVSSPMMRVEGVNMDSKWVQSMVASFSDPEASKRPNAVRDLMLLAAFAVTSKKPAAESPEAADIEHAIATVNESFAHLDPISQAWLTIMTPPVPVFDPLLAVVRKSDDRLVKIAYLLAQSVAGDPMVDAARRSEDPVIRRLGEIIVLERQRAAAAAAAAAQQRGQSPQQR